jgi:hypothetical protein
MGKIVNMASSPSASSPAGHNSPAPPPISGLPDRRGSRASSFTTGGSTRVSDLEDQYSGQKVQKGVTFVEGFTQKENGGDSRQRSTIFAAFDEDDESDGLHALRGFYAEVFRTRQKKSSCAQTLYCGPRLRAPPDVPRPLQDPGITRASFGTFRGSFAQARKRGSSKVKVCTVDGPPGISQAGRVTACVGLAEGPRGDYGAGLVFRQPGHPASRGGR